MDKPTPKQFTDNIVMGFLTIIILVIGYYIIQINKFNSIYIILGIILISYVLGWVTRLAKYYLFEYEIKDENKKK